MSPERDTHSSENAHRDGDMLSLLWKKGLQLGKKGLIAAIIISCAPLLLPSLFIIFIIGVVSIVPYGMFLGSYAFTEKLMSNLIPSTIPPPPVIGYREYDNESYDKISEDTGIKRSKDKENIDEEDEKKIDIRGDETVKGENVDEESKDFTKNEKNDNTKEAENVKEQEHERESIHDHKSAASHDNVEVPVKDNLDKAEEKHELAADVGVSSAKEGSVAVNEPTPTTPRSSKERRKKKSGRSGR